MGSYAYKSIMAKDVVNFPSYHQTHTHSFLSPSFEGKIAQDTPFSHPHSRRNPPPIPNNLHKEWLLTRASFCPSLGLETELGHNMRVWAGRGCHSTRPRPLLDTAAAGGTRDTRRALLLMEGRMSSTGLLSKNIFESCLRLVWVGFCFLGWGREGGGREALAPRCSILLLRKEQGSRDGRCCKGTGTAIWIFSLAFGGFLTVLGWL